MHRCKLVANLHHVAIDHECDVAHACREAYDIKRLDSAPQGHGAAEVGRLHPNEAVWDAATSYSVHFSGQSSGATQSHAELSVKPQQRRKVEPGKTCAGRAGLHALPSTYLADYGPKSAQVCSILTLQCCALRGSDYARLRLQSHHCERSLA